MATEARSKETKGRRRWVPVWVRWVLVVLAVLILPSVVTIWMSERRFQAELAKIRAEGYPTNCEELQSYYESQDIPPEEDCTKLWQRAAGSLRAVNQAFERREPKYWRRLPFVGNVDVPELGRPWTDITFAENYLDEQQETFEWISKATAKGGRSHGDYRLDPDHDSALFDALGDRMRLARLLHLDRTVHLHRNRIDQAMRSMEQLFALRRSTRTAPRTLCGLLEAAFSIQAIAGAKDLIGHRAIREADLEILEDNIRDFDSRQTIQAGFAGQRAIVIDECYDVTNSPVSDWPGIYRHRDDFLVAAQYAIDMCDRDWPEFVSMSRSFPQYRTTTMFGHHVSQLDGTAWFDASSRIPLAGLEARRRLALVGLAMRRYTMRYHDLPDTLDALVPEFLAKIPVDPFTNQSFQYEINNNGNVVLKSVGYDSEFGQNQSDWLTGLEDPTFSFHWPPVTGAPSTSKKTDDP